MAVNPSPFGPKPQFELSDGTPAVGNQLFFYVAGSVGTKQNTYTDSTGGSANLNPLVLNSLGEPTTQIWFTAGQTYKVVYAPSTDTDPPTSPIWTIDNLAGINDTTVTQDEWKSGPTPTYISASNFSLVGDQTATFSLGRRCKFTVTAGTVYGTIINTVFGVATTITMKMDAAFALDAGLSAVSYGLISAAHPSTPAATINAQPVVNGRLTLTTATAVTTSDVTAAASVFFTPYKGNTVDLYDGSANWNRYTFSELTLAVPANTSQMYDVFLQNNSGTLQLNAVAWTNDTTRATALVLQNGVYVKSGATSQLYLGSFRTTTVANQTEDSFAKRYVWNYFNRVRRPMRVLEASNTWNYTTNTFRQANGSTANQLDMVIGVSEDLVEASVNAACFNATVPQGVQITIGLDSTTTAATGVIMPPTTLTTANLVMHMNAEWKGFPGAGRHTLVWLETDVTASGITTWLGTNASSANTQTGIHGSVFA